MPLRSVAQPGAGKYVPTGCCTLGAVMHGSTVADAQGVRWNQRLFWQPMAAADNIATAIKTSIHFIADTSVS